MSLRGVTKKDILSVVIKDIVHLIFYTEMCRQCFKLDESRKKINRKTHNLLSIYSARKLVLNSKISLTLTSLTLSIDPSNLYHILGPKQIKKNVKNVRNKKKLCHSVFPNELMEVFLRPQTNFHKSLVNHTRLFSNFICILLITFIGVLSSNFDKC